MSEELKEFVCERVRMNLSQTAKGAFQIDVTAESGSVERSAELLRQGIAAARSAARDEGFALTSD